MTDQPQPRLLGGRYELGGLLGRGGMAEVRRARDLRLNRDVAIKQLRIDLATDATFQERFRREAQAAAKLNHPNIVAVYDTGDEPDPDSAVRVPYIVMELVQGHTLREILRMGRQIQPTKALEFAEGVLDALSYSHKAGIVHRDIKPANVMLTPDGTVKVMDFGIARAVADTSSTMTQTAAVIGTAQYLSPEQARGETVDARSDIYSAGCLLYELLVGRPPFTGDSPVSVAYQHVREAPIPPSQLDAMITGMTDAVVLKALAKDPADRYQSAGAMRADVARLLGGQEVLARPVTIPSQAPTQVVTAIPGGMPMAEPSNTELARAARAVEEPEDGRRIGIWVFVGALVLVLLGVTGFFVFKWASPPTVESKAVPRVIDQKQEVAMTTLKEAGFVGIPQTVQGEDDDSVGRVVRQEPFAGTLAPIGSEVQFWINIGPTKQAIPPGLVGQLCTDVETRLIALGFTSTSQKPATTEPATAKAGEVLTLDPMEGERVSVGTPITITCATGQSKIPSVVGVLGSAAADQFTDAGFTNVKTVVELQPKGGDVPVGFVFKVTDAAGVELARGTLLDRTTEIRLYVVKQPPVPSATPSKSPTIPPTTAPPPTGEPEGTAGG